MNLMFWKKKTTAEDTQDEAANANPAHPKRRLIIGVAIGTLILTAIGMATWKISRPSPKQNVVKVDTPAETQPISLPDKPLIKLPPIETRKIEPPQTENSLDAGRQAEIDSLKKMNDELQAQIEALKKNQQQPSVSPANQTASKALPPTSSGDMAVGSKNPRATAMTLKQAIEAMNSSSGDTPQKAAK
jgi:hypothetical protein